MFGFQCQSFCVENVIVPYSTLFGGNDYWRAVNNI